MRTSKILVKCAETDRIPPPSVLNDYFGHIAIEDGVVDTIFGLYQFLWMRELITLNDLEKHFANNSLDHMLQHAFRNITENKYWQEFKSWGKGIGATFIGPAEDFPPMMNVVFDKSISIVHTKQNIQSKISKHKQYDQERFNEQGNITCDNVIEMLTKQKLKCAKCNDTVLISGYLPKCWYQFSIDRIDNQKPHNKANVVISCFYCNCKEYIEMHYGPVSKKKCPHGCH